MEKTNSMFKGLGYAYLITLVAILFYNLLLTFTSMGGNTIAMVASIITTVSAAFAGFYVSKKVGEKGLIYGLGAGLIYIALLAVTVFLVNGKFAFEMTMLYKMGLTSLAGGIGGVLGVNFK